MEEATHTSRAAQRASGGEHISRPGLRSGEPSGFRRVSCHKQQNERTHSVLAWLRLCCRFLRVPTVGLGSGSRKEPQHRHCHPPRVAGSFVHVGNVIVRRQDTSRARVQVVEPLVGDLRVAQDFDSCHLLPGDQLAVKAALWSCSALSRALPGR